VPVAAPAVPAVEVPGAPVAVAADPAPVAEAGSWPAEVTPADEQQPTASA
jgi:hypothetical protein